ncbi:MAG: metallophosphoesterase [Victivallaceae bacterium]|nr:metallophosphoesterase [Victivallaceae bacterium]
MNISGVFHRFFSNIRRSPAKRAIAAVCCGCVLCGMGGGIWAFYIEPASFQVNHYSVRLHNWHDEHNGLKVAVLTDIHLLKTPYELMRLQRIVAAVNAESPDIVVLLGDYMGNKVDYMNHNASAETIAGILHGLRGRYGCYAVLGNHDVWWNADRMCDALSAAGITVLENSHRSLLINGKTLNVIGLPDKTTRNNLFDPSVLPDPAIPALLLSHNPDYFPNAALHYEFMMAGHTHGGQVKLPLVGALVMSSRYGRKYTEGLCRDNGRQLFVSRGIGTSILHLRFMCPPEVAIIKIYRAESGR